MVQRRRLLLDSNTLLLLFVGTFNKRLIERFKRTAQFAEADLDLLAELLDSFGFPVTTAHILTEVSNLSGHLKDATLEAYFDAFASNLDRIDELEVSAKAAAAEPIFRRLGLTDAAITHVARRDSLVVVTTDLDLFAALTQAGIEAHNFNHLRSSRLVPSPFEIT